MQDVSPSRRAQLESTEGSHAELPGDVTPASDAELVARYLKYGHYAAFEELIVRHSLRVRRYLRMRGVGLDELDDATQEVLLLVSSRLKVYDMERPFVGFILQQARLEALHRTTRASRQAHVTPIDEGDDAAAVEYGLSYGSPERTSMASDAYGHLLRTLATSDGPAHQILTFGFIKLLEYTPAEFAKDFASVPLDALAMEFKSQYINLSGLEAEFVEEALRPLTTRLEVPQPGKVLPGMSLQPSERSLGKMTVASYYSPNERGDVDPETQISNWWQSERRRLVKRLSVWFGVTLPNRGSSK